LIFLAIGIGNLLNTTLKASFFTEAEKRDYSVCNVQPYFSMPDVKNLENAATDEQKAQISSLVADYQNWKQQNTGEECYKAERQKKIVDALTMIVVSLPIYLFHWSFIIRERKNKEENE
jgi:hypothetical protein